MISDHETKVLGHSRILEFHKFYSEFQFWLQAGAERFRMKLRIYETSDGRFCFVQSHYIQPSSADASFHATHLTHATPHLALSSAIDTITTFYDEATGAGGEPSLDWFVPNELF